MPDATLFVRLMQGAFSRFLEAADDQDREAALNEMSVLIRRNYQGDLDESFDVKLAQAHDEAQDGDASTE